MHAWLRTCWRIMVCARTMNTQDHVVGLPRHPPPRWPTRRDGSEMVPSNRQPRSGARVSTAVPEPHQPTALTGAPPRQGRGSRPLRMVRRPKPLPMNRLMVDGLTVDGRQMNRRGSWSPCAAIGPSSLPRNLPPLPIPLPRSERGRGWRSRVRGSLSGSWPRCASNRWISTLPLNLHTRRAEFHEALFVNVARLQPGTRGARPSESGSWSQCAPISASELPMTRTFNAQRSTLNLQLSTELPVEC